jgi:formylglycine-generating enzyme required for sulfatase activity
MKKSLFYLIVVVALASCYSGPRGELVGVYPREEWVQVNPYGMNYIHFGSFTMGPSDQDVPYALDARSKTITLPAFYIDQHEISNNEYRQFVYYVRDSLMRDLLAQNEIEGFAITEDENTGRELEGLIDKGYLINWEEPVDMENEEVYELI